MGGDKALLFIIFFAWCEHCIPDNNFKSMLYKMPLLGSGGEIVVTAHLPKQRRQTVCAYCFAFSFSSVAILLLFVYDPVFLEN